LEVLIYVVAVYANLCTTRIIVMVALRIASRSYCMSWRLEGQRRQQSASSTIWYKWGCSKNNKHRTVLFFVMGLLIGRVILRDCKLYRLFINHKYDG